MESKATNFGFFVFFALFGVYDLMKMGFNGFDGVYAAFSIINFALAAANYHAYKYGE